MATVAQSNQSNGSIAPQLSAVYEKFATNAPPQFITVIQENLDKLERHDKENAVQVGQQLPPFELLNAVGGTTSSKDILDSPLLVAFYRGTWCPFCNIALFGLQKRMPEFRARGLQIAAISPQLPDGSISTKETHDLEFHMLSDVDNKYARQLGLVWQMTDSMRPLLEHFGHDFVKFNGNDTHELPVTAAFLVDKSGTVLERYMVPDYTKRIEPSQVIEWLDKHNFCWQSSHSFI